MGVYLQDVDICLSTLDFSAAPMQERPMHEHKDATLKRLKRLEGQIRGIARMVEDDRYCVDVLTQISAARAALKGVEKLVIDDHASHCIEDALASGDLDDQRAKFTELLDLLDKARG